MTAVSPHDARGFFSPHMIRADPLRECPLSRIARAVPLATALCRTMPVDVTSKHSAADLARETEPMLQPTSNRFVFDGVRHRDLWELYELAQANFWTANEFDPQDDLPHWDKLSEDERNFILVVLSFFAASDGVVTENLCENFAVEVQWVEARFFYGFQIAMENIHSETYGLLLSTYCQDEAKRAKYFNAIETAGCVQRKAQWAMRWITEGSFAERLLAFACVEGIFFSGSFCAIFWLKKKGIMPGLTFTNELISRDEHLHCRFACALYNKLEQPLPLESVHAMIRDAVAIEQEFCREALKVPLIGMNAQQMSAHIEFIADRLLLLLGLEPLFRTANPFQWQELQSLTGKTNFFEKRNSDYQKTGVLSSRAYGEDDDF